jgi:hypothetical protein
LTFFVLPTVALRVTLLPTILPVSVDSSEPTTEYGLLNTY